MCVYALHARVCEPKGDGISSQHNLLEASLLRVSVWVVAALSCAGNLLVLLGRWIIKEDNQVHSFFIKNLSLADLCMGVYLVIIAARDYMYRGRYIYYQLEWRSSWLCNFSGFLSTVSSEVSVFTLLVITLDRYMCIMYPFRHKWRSLRISYCAMAAIWVVCIVLSLLPLSGLTYFKTDFYSNNGVCLPLQIHDPWGAAWEYSAFLFLGLNFAAFLFIAYAYLVMFMTIRRSQMSLRSTQESQEASLVKRFFFIVLTDFACWIPIIITKILALSGKRSLEI